MKGTWSKRTGYYEVAHFCESWGMPPPCVDGAVEPLMLRGRVLLNA